MLVFNKAVDQNWY